MGVAVGAVAGASFDAGEAVFAGSFFVGSFFAGLFFADSFVADSAGFFETSARGVNGWCDMSMAASATSCATSAARPA